MRLASIPALLAASLAGALIVVACSDDSPTDADAAVCDCPAAEPPITQARVHRVDSGPGTLAPGQSGHAVALCPAGDIVLSGSCFLSQDPTGLIFMKGSYAVPQDPAMAPNGWACDPVNTGTIGDAEYHAQAICLRPAP